MPACNFSEVGRSLIIVAEACERRPTNLGPATMGPMRTQRLSGFVTLFGDCSNEYGVCRQRGSKCRWRPRRVLDAQRLRTDSRHGDERVRGRAERHAWPEGSGALVSPSQPFFASSIASTRMQPRRRRHRPPPSLASFGTLPGRCGTMRGAGQSPVPLACTRACSSVIRRPRETPRSMSKLTRRRQAARTPRHPPLPRTDEGRWGSQGAPCPANGCIAFLSKT